MKGDAQCPPVSSNDVLLSTMANLIDARLFGEAISLRGKLPGFDTNDAGNYESLLWLDKEVYESPLKIRRMMAAGIPYRGRCLPLPGFWEGLHSSLVFCLIGQISLGHFA